MSNPSVPGAKVASTIYLGKSSVSINCFLFSNLFSSQPCPVRFSPEAFSLTLSHCSLKLGKIVRPTFAMPLRDVLGYVAMT